jgi:hypothetical protein
MLRRPEPTSPSNTADAGSGLTAEIAGKDLPRTGREDVTNTIFAGMRLFATWR